MPPADRSAAPSAVPKSTFAKSAKPRQPLDPVKLSIDTATQKMIAHIDKKRKALGIDRARERVFIDMESRRGLEAG